LGLLSFEADALAAGASLRCARGPAARGANSKPIFPSAPRTRNAEKGLPFLEINRCSRSVLPVASSFFISSISMGR
jgi:hypothetical protein